MEGLISVRVRIGEECDTRESAAGGGNQEKSTHETFQEKVKGLNSEMRWFSRKEKKVGFTHHTEAFPTLFKAPLSKAEIRFFFSCSGSV